MKFAAFREQFEEAGFVASGRFTRQPSLIRLVLLAQYRRIVQAVQTTSEKDFTYFITAASVENRDNLNKSKDQGREAWF